MMRKDEAMISRQEAFDRLDQALGDVRLPGVTLPVSESQGRVLYSDQLSQLTLPPFDRSAMDGFALCADDEQEQYQIVGTVAAGQVSETQLEPGMAMRIMTGAPVPAGGARVVRVEDTEVEGDTLRVLKFEPKTHIAPQGQDLKQGERVMAAGTVLGPVQIANLVSCGITAVEVVRSLRLYVLSTGDEIVDHPDQLEPGKIMNSNGPMLAALATECGLELVGVEQIGDQPDATGKAIAQAMERADIVVLSGGVSMGEYDYVLDAIGDLGLDMHFSRVAILPGKPTVFASRGARLVFGLPGNPVSVFVMFQVFVRRAMARLAGREPDWREYPMRLGEDYKRRKTERLQYVPCQIREDGSVAAVPYHGSGHLAALLAAEGFFIMPVGEKKAAAGEMVSFLPWPKGL